MSFVRGFNPIWFEVDLSAEPFDDTYWMFVLQNTFPYLPAVVYHDPAGTIPWNNPIQFLANGTLPIDIFFNTGTTENPAVYRLEFRRGQTQSDPLIYLVEDYIPGTGGGSVSSVALISDNQITNNQFSLINFSSPLEIISGSTQTIDVAPGWFLDLTGTGNVTLTQVPLNSSAGTKNPTNAPYALEITVTGWDAEGVVLRQRFNEAGMLWSGKTVASSVTARINGAGQTITAIITNSNATLSKEVLEPVLVSGTFTEYQGLGTLPAPTNTDVPPDAYIEYKLILPSNVDIYLTSFQLVVSTIANKVPYVQDSIERQQDYTFHYYRDSLLTQPKESLLTGWDFGLNPWQFRQTTDSVLLAQCAYTADQTIVYQQAGGSEVAVGRSGAQENYSFVVTANGNNSRFAVIQYIDPNTIRDIWGYALSSLVRAHISTPTHATTVRFKMRLIYRASLPPTIGATQPIASWTGSDDPDFVGAGWTEVIPKNDPVYTLETASRAFTFEGMSLIDVPSSSDDMTLGIVLYTLDPIIETATADRILFERVSLTRTDFAIDAQILTFDETLRRCQYYYESSKNLYILPTVSGAQGALIRSCYFAQVVGDIKAYAKSFNLEYNTLKRASAETIVYSEIGTKDNVSLYFRDNGVALAGSPANIVFTTGWTSQFNGNKGIQFAATGQTASPIGTVIATVSNSTDAYISFHYTADSRMGT